MEKQPAYLSERYRQLAGYLGLLMQVMAVVMAVPALVALFVPQDAAHLPAFLGTALGLAAAGTALRLLVSRRRLEALDFKESSIVVLVTWLASSLAGSIPYLVVSRMSFSHAVFDSVSGWTTTGLSLLDLTQAPPIMLFFRAWTQFVGGAGFAIIMLASLTGVGAAHIYSAEGKGSLIKPNVLASARIVVSLYLGYLAFGLTAYLLAGMRPLNALVYSFCAISTGGFANHLQSIGFFDSPLIEAITLVLMVLGNLSFVSGYFLVKARFRNLLRNGELKVLFASVLIALPLVFFGVTSHLFANSSKAMRVAVFEVFSALTTTGYSTVSYNSPLWNEGGILVLIVLMLIGGGTCSTAGGIKQYRVYMAYKSVLWHLKRSLRPASAVVRNFVWEGDRKDYAAEAKQQGITNFILAYLALFLAGTALIGFSRDPQTGGFYSLRDAVFEFASALGTVGLSVGVTSTQAPLTVIWAETIGMLLGRLEIFVVFIAIGKMMRDLGHRLRFRGGKSLHQNNS